MRAQLCRFFHVRDGLRAWCEKWRSPYSETTSHLVTESHMCAYLSLCRASTCVSPKHPSDFWDFLTLPSAWLLDAVRAATGVVDEFQCCDSLWTRIRVKYVVRRRPHSMNYVLHLHNHILHILSVVCSLNTQSLHSQFKREFLDDFFRKCRTFLRYSLLLHRYPF